MDAALLTPHVQQALTLAVLVSLPVLAIAACVALVVAVIQAAIQIQDGTLAHLPRLIAVAGALTLLGPWMGKQIAAYAAQLFALVSTF